MEAGVAEGAGQSAVGKTGAVIGLRGTSTGKGSTDIQKQRLTVHFRDSHQDAEGKILKTFVDDRSVRVQSVKKAYRIGQAGGREAARFKDEVCLLDRKLKGN